MRILIGFLATWLAIPAAADVIDDVIAAEMGRQHIPGVAIAVIKDGELLKEAGYGIANLEHSVKVTPDTMFQTGSVGKQFTAALVLLLAKDGKLELDAPVSRYLPGVPDSWHGITLRHLLGHTAGLPDHDAAIDLKRDYSDDELLTSALTIVPDAPPGDRWRYSNLGYQLLGLICTRVGGAFYGDQLRERIFAPLGMRSRVISERDLVPHRAAGYVRVDGTFSNQDWVAPTLNTTADGSLHMSTRDLARWALALDTDDPLDDDVKTAMWTPVRLNDGSAAGYGFGWELGQVHGHRVQYHAGAWQGFTAFFSRYPDDGLTVIALANRSRTNLAALVDRIAGVVVPALAEAPRTPLTAAMLPRTPVFVSGTVNDDWHDIPLRRVATGLYEVQRDLGPGFMAFKISAKNDGIASLGAAFDEQPVRLAEKKPLVSAGEYLLLKLEHRTTYVFRLDFRDADAPSVIVREVTR